MCGGSSCKSVPGVSTWGKEKQSFQTEISQAAQFIQLSCEAQLSSLKWEKVWVWFRNLLHPLIHSLIKLLLCLLEQQRARVELECTKMGIFQDNESIGNSCYCKKYCKTKRLFVTFFFNTRAGQILIQKQ